MSNTLNQWLKVERGRKKKYDAKPLSGEERFALRTLRNEAHEAGSKLASGGRGGLPPSLVLGVMRRDKYTCKRCGELGTSDNGGITVHHIGGIDESVWASKKGHKNEPNNLVTLCTKCHDAIHAQARAEGDDSSQGTPIGDEGTKRDHGLPEVIPNPPIKPK